MNNKVYNVIFIVNNIAYKLCINERLLDCLNFAMSFINIT